VDNPDITAKKKKCQIGERRRLSFAARPWHQNKVWSSGGGRTLLGEGEMATKKTTGTKEEF